MGKNKTKKGDSHSIYFDDDVWDKLNKEARDNRRSRSFIINEAIEKYLKKRGKS